MAEVTRLDDADVRALAGRFGLGEVVQWRAIAAGTINSNFFLRCGQDSYFLRVNEGKSEEEVAYEAALVDQLAALGVPTPRPLDAEGRPYASFAGKWVSVFPWVAGRHLEREEIGPAVTEAMGRALAGLHAAADRVRGLPERYGIYTFEAIAARAGSFASSRDPELVDANRAIAEEVAYLSAAGAPTELGIIHGDLFVDNVLFAVGPDEPRVAALLDFEQASLGSRIYDLAVCINAWCYREAFDPATVAAMVRGYESLRSSVDGEVLYRELRRAAWRFTVTRITDVYLAGGRDPAKDFRRYLRRLESWRQLGAGGLRSWLSSGAA